MFERVLSPWVANLKRIGIDATIRQVDPAQYQSRLNDFDFDVILAAFIMGATPLDGLSQFFGIEGRRHSRGRATMPASRSKAVDGLLDQLAGGAEPRRAGDAAHGDRPGAAGRAIRHAELVSCANHRVAHWDIFGWPEKKPDYGFTPETTWWFDADKAAAIGYSRVGRAMGAYILRRILLIIPTMIGIMAISFAVVQFAPGGPVERIIAQLQGTDVSATSRITGGGGDFAGTGNQQAAAAATR